MSTLEDPLEIVRIMDQAASWHCDAARSLAKVLGLLVDVTDSQRPDEDDEAAEARRAVAFVDVAKLADAWKKLQVPT